MAATECGEAETQAALMGALGDAFAAEGRPGGAMAAAALRTAAGQEWRGRPSSSDPAGLIAEAAALPDALPVASLVARLASRIGWESWGTGKLDDATAASLHSAELVGPDGHVAADGVRVGLLVSAPGTDYPLSSHSGEETYWVIAGTAVWHLGEESRAVPPGSLVHHPAWAPHGRRTEAEPFLGAWRWSGDLDLASFRVEDGA